MASWLRKFLLAGGLPPFLFGLVLFQQQQHMAKLSFCWLVGSETNFIFTIIIGMVVAFPHNIFSDSFKYLNHYILNNTSFRNMFSH